MDIAAICPNETALSYFYSKFYWSFDFNYAFFPSVAVKRVLRINHLKLNFAAYFASVLVACCCQIVKTDKYVRFKVLKSPYIYNIFVLNARYDEIVN